MIASLLTPVWSAELSTTMLGGYSDEANYNSFWMNEKTSGSGEDDSSTTSLMDLDSDLQTPLIWLIIMTVITIVLSLAALFNDFRWRSAKMGKVALACAAIMALATPLVFMVNWTSALEANSYDGYDIGFSGKEHGLGFDLEYGPDVGWYLYFLAFGLLAIALIMSLAVNKKENA